MTTLFQEVRSSQNLFSAWRHVKRSALASSSNDIRGHAAEFEHQHHRYLKRIGDQLRRGIFQFDEFEGVLKDKKAREARGKDPRPIAIGSIKNRIVQRAILQVLQPRRNSDEKSIDGRPQPKIDERIGFLNDVNRSPYGVGGLLAPYGGVQPAIRFVLDSMRKGATQYYQSDIKAFFTAIPVRAVVEKVREATADEDLVRLFEKALEVQLKNKDELGSYSRLFPSDGRGVAQGSSLSAFAGNILLFDLDKAINSLGVYAVRYIDDIVILAETETELNAAIDFTKSALKKYGFSLYEPVPGSEKASHGACTKAFDFLGCTIQPNRCVPSRVSVNSFLEEVRATLQASKIEIRRLLDGNERFDPSKAKSATIDRLGKKAFGWQKSFSFSTDQQAFRYIDEQMSALVDDYDQQTSRWLAKADPALRARALGVPSMTDLYTSAVKRKAV